MAERLRYLRPGMAALLGALAAQYPTLGYLGECRALLLQGEPFPAAWSRSLRDFPGIGEGEREALLSLGDVLGSTGLEGQLAALACVRGSLEEWLSQAREARERHGRLYSSLGALGGLALVIVFY